MVRKRGYICDQSENGKRIPCSPDWRNMAELQRARRFRQVSSRQWR